MSENPSHHYTNDEVSRIIRRALKIKNEDSISHEDLIETARDLELDPQVVETAIKQEREEFNRKRTRKARLNRRKAGFYRHLSIYLVVNIVLLLIDMSTPGPGWFHWSVVGWGTGVACHFMAVFLSEGNGLQTA